MTRKKDMGKGEGFGKALKKDLGREADIAKDIPGARGGRALFMNEKRRELFTLLCARPCLHLSGIARVMRLSVPTVRWHLNKLMAGGFITSRTHLRKMVYFPSGLLEEEDVRILAVLNDDGSKDVYTNVLESPGLSQKDLTGLLDVRHQVVMWHAARLVEAGLISIVEDGRYRRYYPTDLLQLRETAERGRHKHFREALIGLLKTDGVDPEVVRATERSLDLMVTGGTRRRSLKVPTQPFRTVLDTRPPAGMKVGAGPLARRSGEMHIPAHRSRRSSGGGRKRRG